MDASTLRDGWNAPLMGVNVFLAGVVAWRFSGGSRAAGVATAVLVAASFNVLYVHGFVVSEPLMLALFLGGLLLLDRLLTAPSTKILVGLTLCCVGAALVRYAGIAPTATAAVVVLLSKTLGRGDGTTDAVRRDDDVRYTPRSSSSAAWARSRTGWRCWHSTAPPREHVRWRCTCRATSTPRPASRPWPVGS